MFESPDIRPLSATDISPSLRQELYLQFHESVPVRRLFTRSPAIPKLAITVLVSLPN